MSIASVKFEIARYYRTALDHVAVEEHGGPFSLQDIGRYAIKSPAVIIGCMGVPEFKIQGTVVTAQAVFGAFCLAHESVREKRDVASLLLAESVAVETVSNNWDGSASGTPRNIRGANLYSVALDKMGVAMWAIRWDQLIDLQRNTIATLDDWETMYSTYDIAQTDDTVNTTDITELP